jgi:hypothetical protein
MVNNKNISVDNWLYYIKNCAVKPSKSTKINIKKKIRGRINHSIMNNKEN